MEVNKLSYIAKTIWIFACLATSYIVGQRLITVQAQNIKNIAIDNCLRNSGTYEYTDTKGQVKTTAPQKEYYRICLADKGYSTIWE